MQPPLCDRQAGAASSGRLDGVVANVKNDPDNRAQARAVTSALFLRRFGLKGLLRVHLDILAWDPKVRPGRPQGAEAQGIRAPFTMLDAAFA